MCKVRVRCCRVHNSASERHRRTEASWSKAGVSGAAAAAAVQSTRSVSFVERWMAGMSRKQAEGDVPTRAGTPARSQAAATMPPTAAIACVTDKAPKKTAKRSVVAAHGRTKNSRRPASGLL